MTRQGNYWAHSDPDGRSMDDPQARLNPLREHLEDVADLAARFAEPWHGIDEARAAGLLHDLGKYGDLFQKRLTGEATGIDHWSAGAYVAWWRWRQKGMATALAIQGHHLGLQRAEKAELDALDPHRLKTAHPLNLRLSEDSIEVLAQRYAAECPPLPTIATSVASRGNDGPVATMLQVRMLYSALVDADFLATEAHFGRLPNGGKGWRAPGPQLDAGTALGHLQDLVARRVEKCMAAPEVKALRADLLADCLGAATSEPGLFTLTAPTGAGKTLSMLAFALEHARLHGLRRIVCVIPYLSIIEQTAGEYREALATNLGPEYVLEHHSMARVSAGRSGSPTAPEQARASLLAENWDAPLVVTTSVQLLESLFANRPAACRKLHRLAGSVILFDEVQTLPVRLAVPILAGLSQLCARFGSTVVFSTATQPAFGHLHERVRSYGPTGWQPREVVKSPGALFSRARRTRVVWSDTQKPLGWDELAGRLADLKHPQVLCIVNLKRHALALLERLEARKLAGLFHLSTNQCPAHRQAVLLRVRAALKSGQPCRVVSTQCVEAGVDLDFPSVWRALGPLDSIAQAAGRCNRGGRLSELGAVRVFQPEVELGPNGKPRRMYPGDDYAAAASVTKEFIGCELDDPKVFERYYRRLYDLAGPELIHKDLDNALKREDFVAVAKHFRLIEKNTINVLVPYEPAYYGALVRDLDTSGRLTRSWIRRAQPHSIGLYRTGAGAGDLANLLRPAPLGRRTYSEDWHILLDPHGQVYDRELYGLREPRTEDCWIA